MRGNEEIYLGSVMYYWNKESNKPAKDEVTASYTDDLEEGIFSMNHQDSLYLGSELFHTESEFRRYISNLIIGLEVKKLPTQKQIDVVENYNPDFNEGVNETIKKHTDTILKTIDDNLRSLISISCDSIPEEITSEWLEMEGYHLLKQQSTPLPFSLETGRFKMVVSKNWYRLTKHGIEVGQFFV